MGASRCDAAAGGNRMFAHVILAHASADKSNRLFHETLPWILLLLGVVIVGGAIIFIARRYMFGAGADKTGGFTLHDLREMHRAGEINDEQFARAKAQMIGRLAAPDKPPDKPPDEAPDKFGHDPHRLPRKSSDKPLHKPPNTSPGRPASGDDPSASSPGNPQTPQE